MARRETEAERLRRCRLLFGRAVALGCTPADVRRIEAEQRHAATEERIAAKRSATQDVIAPAGRCGTQIEEEEERQLPWWQR